MDPLCVSLVYKYLQETNSALLGHFKVKYRPRKTDVALNEVLNKWREEQMVRGLVYQHLRDVAPILAREFMDTNTSPFKVELLGGDPKEMIQKVLSCNRWVKVKENSRVGMKHRCFTVDELERINQAMTNGEDLNTLEKEMGRTKGSLHRKIHHLKRHAGLKTGKLAPEETERIRQAVYNDEDYKSVAAELKRHPSIVHRKMLSIKGNPNGQLKNKRISIEEGIRILDEIIPCLRRKPLSSRFLSQSAWLSLAKETGRFINSLRSHWVRILQPWLLQHKAGTTGLRIERMLTRLVAEKFTGHKGIDWEEIRNQHKEFKGHTSESLCQIFQKVRGQASAQKRDTSLVEVAEFAAEVYQPGKEKQEPGVKIAHREKIIQYFERRVADLGIEVIV